MLPLLSAVDTPRLTNRDVLGWMPVAWMDTIAYGASSADENCLCSSAAFVAAVSAVAGVGVAVAGVGVPAVLASVVVEAGVAALVVAASVVVEAGAVGGVFAPAADAR